MGDGAMERLPARLRQRLERKSPACQSEGQPANQSGGKHIDVTVQFWIEFDQLVQESEKRLAALQNAPHSERSRDISEARHKQQEAESLLSSMANQLTAYNLNKAQHSLASLQTAIEKESSGPSKHSFTFLSKTAGVPVDAKSLGQPNDIIRTQISQNPSTNQSFVDRAGLTIADKQGEAIDMTLDQSGADCVLRNLIDCRVVLRGKPGSLRGAMLKKCTVWLGCVSGPVWLEGCEDCVVHLHCRQLRLHTSKRCDFYLSVNSHPIIEDCSDVRVAPLDVGEAQHENLWDKVNDFNWLRTDRPSPHWTTIPEDQRSDPAVPDLIQTSNQIK